MQQTITPHLILASSSRYRKELLSRLGIPFDTQKPEIDESPLPEELPQNTALRLAYEKALAISNNFPEAIIIGSDQVAECEGISIGKPGTFTRAMEQLQYMRGKQVLFHTALCVLNGRHDPSPQKAIVTTSVVFRNLPDYELADYLAIEKPFDCAGSAKNESLGIALLEKIESDDPTALTGLPLITLTSMLRNCGLRFFSRSKQ